MKYKFLALSLLMAGATVSANAQEKQYVSNNIFVGANVGGMAVLNGGMNEPTFNFNLMVGKYINPTWGVRATVGGIWQTLDEQNKGYQASNKKFVEINADAMLNLNSLFGNKNWARPLDVYVFGGPTVNVGRAVSGALVYNAPSIEVVPGTPTDIVLTPETVYKAGDAKARVGATVGLGLAYNVNQNWAINLEGRYAVAPSLFGEGSDCRKAESTARVNLGFIYTFGGKNFTPTCQVDADALNDEINKYRAELAPSQADLNDAKNALANAKGETVEVVKEVAVVGPRAIFFKIGSAKIDDYGKVNIKLAAEIMKNNTDKKYKVSGYCDKATGSSKFNQKLSEKRAQAVVDALVAEGVSKDQIEVIGNGGTDNMFGKNQLNRVVILE